MPEAVPRTQSIFGRKMKVERKEYKLRCDFLMFLLLIYLTKINTFTNSEITF